MAADRRDRVTEVLAGWDAGSEKPDAEVLISEVYEELRQLARAYLRRERADHTLEPTALVHEAYLRLVDQTRIDWQGKTHFFAVGARMMRRLLVDHARAHGREKRGGEWRRVTLDAASTPLFDRPLAPEDVLALDEALHRLAELDERQARVVELRFFAGMPVDEVAVALGVSKRTVEGDWAHARAWLRRELATVAP